MIQSRLLLGLALATVMAGSLASAAERAGTIKTVRGDVSIDRSGEKLSVSIGDAVMQGDTVVTGPVSFAGITLRDNTRMTAGPNSAVKIDRFSFNTTTHAGGLDTTVEKGTLSVISGKLAKASPDSVKFNTASMTLGVRGTEFIIEAAGE